MVSWNVLRVEEMRAVEPVGVRDDFLAELLLGMLVQVTQSKVFSLFSLEQ